MQNIFIHQTEYLVIRRIAGNLIEGVFDEDFEEYVIQIICDYFRDLVYSLAKQ